MQPDLVVREVEDRGRGPAAQVQGPRAPRERPERSPRLGELLPQRGKQDVGLDRLLEHPR